MKNKLLLITALLSAGTLFSAQQHSHVRPTFQTATVLIPIECSDDQVYVDEQTLEKFNFFAGLTDSYGCNLSDLPLLPFKHFYSPVSVLVDEHGNSHFHMNCTTAVMKLLVDYIETPKELFEDHRKILMARLESLSYEDLASLLKIVDQVNLQEPYLIHLEQLITPLLKNAEIIQEFLDDRFIQTIIHCYDNLNWKNPFSSRFIAASLDRVISTETYPRLHDSDYDLYDLTPVHPDGKMLIAESLGSNGLVIDSTTGRILCTINHGDQVTSCISSPNGKLVASGSYDQTAKVTDIATGETLCTINHTGTVNAVAFSPDGKFLATGSFDNTAKITDISTGQTLCTIIDNGWVNNVAFSPNEKILLIGGHRIPIEEYDPMQSTLINALECHTPRLSFKKLSPEMQEILFTLPENVQTQLITAIPKKTVLAFLQSKMTAALSTIHSGFAKHSTTSDLSDDGNPIPLKHRCPSGEHDTRQGCCGCGYDDVD